MGWQDEIPTLPFQPDEEECLNKIIRDACAFRNYLAPYINPLLSVPDELTTQRFYLRKIEGADILLAQETNWFRQELHKFAPVAPEPPPIIEISSSTRKPRPTKQQKKMKELGIENPDDLPPEFRTKSHHFKNRKVSETQARNPQVPVALKPAQSAESHTPPGLPHGYAYSPSIPTTFNPAAASAAPSSAGSHPTFTYDSMSGSTTGFQPNQLAATTTLGSPLFASSGLFTQGGFHSPPQPPASLEPQLDPAIFGSPPSNSQYGGSNQGGSTFNDMFSDLTNTGRDDMKSMAAHALGLAGDEEQTAGEADGLEFIRTEESPSQTRSGT